MLDARKEEAISMLIIGAGPSEIARKVCVSRKTIYDWQLNPEFKEEFEKRQKEIVTTGNAYVMAHVQSHLEVIHNLALDSKDSRTALSAAIYMVDRALGTRVTKVENVVSDKDNIPIDVLDSEIDEFEQEIKLVK